LPITARSGFAAGAFFTATSGFFGKAFGRVTSRAAARAGFAFTTGFFVTIRLLRSAARDASSHSIRPQLALRPSIHTIGFKRAISMRTAAWRAGSAFGLPRVAF
jgi:hypothetical protein